MKIFKLMVVALVAMLGFTACDKDCDHDFIEHDHSADFVGTWTCLTANYAEALVIKADGSVLSTGIAFGEHWKNVKGNIVVKDDNVTMTFEDHDNYEGHIDIIPGVAFSINNKEVGRFTYNYCKEDLSEEILGMWVCNDGLPGEENDMAIMSFSENGKMTMTTHSNAFNTDDVVNMVSDYVVVGDLVLHIFPNDNVISDGYYNSLATRVIYSPNGTSLGDILTQISYVASENGIVELTSSFLRVKQSLDLTGKTYDYSTAYVTSAKGKDEDFTIMGNTFNIAKIKGYDFDKMFSANLFCVELNANSFKYKLRLDNGQYTGFDTPMTVDGNKVILDMSAINPALRKVEMYMFQDANDTQVHIYMHTDAFINYFANMEVYTLIMEGKINQTDEAAIAKVFADMEARVESINVSFVMKARK